MAIISEQNARRRQLFCLQGYFGLRLQPFWRPLDLAHFAHGIVGKLGHSTTMPGACRLALSKMASNLDEILNRS